MSARDDHPYVAHMGDSVNQAMQDGLNAMFDEIDALRAELEGLRVRTLTAETDADRLAAASEGIKRGLARIDWGTELAERELFAALAAHEIAVRARVAGETGDTP